MNALKSSFITLACAAWLIGSVAQAQPAPASGELTQEIDLPVEEEFIPFAPLAYPKVEFAAPPREPSLIAAVLQNNRSLVERLVRLGADLNAPDELGDTPLCAALREGHTPLAIWLLLQGADPNVTDREGQTPIAYASLRNHPTLMGTLLQAGADPNQALKFPPSPTFLAGISDAALIKQLKLHQGMTPLMVAAFRGDVEGVDQLMRGKAKVNAFTRPYSRYAINFAAQKNYLYIMRLLLGRQPDKEPRVLITINLSQQRARLEVDGETKLETKISSGRKGYETPPGRFVITNRHRDWTSTIYHAKMPYFLRLNCSAIGLHSGYVTGRPASHGCIRLPPSMAHKFFAMTTVGDEVSIEP